MKYVYLILVTIATVACVRNPDETGSGTGGDTGMLECSTNEDCPEKPCARGVCAQDHTCALSPIPVDVPCGNGFVCGGLGQCLCLGCTDGRACYVGESTDKCGTDGVPCVLCGNGETCQDGACVPD